MFPKYEIQVNRDDGKGWVFSQHVRSFDSENGRAAIDEKAARLTEHPDYPGRFRRKPDQS